MIGIKYQFVIKKIQTDSLTTPNIQSGLCMLYLVLLPLYTYTCIYIYDTYMKYFHKYTYMSFILNLKIKTQQTHKVCDFDFDWTISSKSPKQKIHNTHESIKTYTKEIEEKSDHAAVNQILRAWMQKGWKINIYTLKNISDLSGIRVLRQSKAVLLQGKLGGANIPLAQHRKFIGTPRVVRAAVSAVDFLRELRWQINLHSS